MPSMIVLNAKRTRKLPGVRSPKPVEVRARRAIDSLMAPMLADVAARLAGLDSMANIADVILALREAQDVWERAFSWKAEGLAGRWALDVDVIAKEKLGRAVGKALGIDMAMILDAPDVAVSVRLASMEAAQLIRTIPTDYIGRVSRAVYQSMRQQPFPEGRTLAEEIHLLGRVTKERAPGHRAGPDQQDEYEHQPNPSDRARHSRIHLADVRRQPRGGCAGWEVPAGERHAREPLRAEREDFPMGRTAG